MWAMNIYYIIVSLGLLSGKYHLLCSAFYLQQNFGDSAPKATYSTRLQTSQTWVMPKSDTSFIFHFILLLSEAAWPILAY